MSDNNIRKIMKEADAPEMVAERIRETAQTIKAQAVSKQTENSGGQKSFCAVPNRNRWNRRKVAILTAAAVCVIGGTVFAAAAYRMNLQKTDSYAISAELTAEDELPDSVPAVTVNPCYIPAGFVYDEEKEYYVNEASDAGYVIGTEPLLLDRAESFVQTEIVDAEALKINGRDALYTCAVHNAADPAWLDQHLYLAWPEASRVVTGWAWGHADKDELVKMMEETELTLGETTVSTRDLDRWSDYTAWLNSNTEEVTVDDFITSASAEEMAGAHQLGEEFPLKEEGELFATVTDVKIMEDVSLLNKDLIQCDWETLVDDSGRLLEDEILYMKEGDGVSTMTEIVRSEKEPVKLVYATVEYRNDTAEDMSDVWFLSTLVPMTEENGTWHLLAQGGEDYDYTQNATGIVGIPEPTYHDVNGEGTVKNYIPFIAAGESATVHYAWLMNENQLEDSLYLDLAAATMYSIMPESLETGLVKVK